MPSRLAVYTKIKDRKIQINNKNYMMISLTILREYATFSSKCSYKIYYIYYLFIKFYEKHLTFLSKKKYIEWHIIFAIS